MNEGENKTMIIDCSNTIPEYRFDGTFEEDPKNSKYVKLFGSTWAQWAGMSKEEFSKRLAGNESAKEIMQEVNNRLKEELSMDNFIKMLDESEVRYHAIHNMDYGRDKYESPADHDRTAQILEEYPDRFIAYAGYNPHKGTESLKVVRKALLEQGYRGVVIAPYEHGIGADDRRYYPLYSLCDELEVPIWIHSSINYYDNESVFIDHPKSLEKPLNDFANLKIIAGHGGWPWIQDLIAMLLKYDNLYVDISAFRPKYINMKDTGWDMFMYYADNLIQNQLVFGSDWVTIGMPIKQILSEVEEWDLKDSVREKMMWKNANRLFKLNLTEE